MKFYKSKSNFSRRNTLFFLLIIGLPLTYAAYKVANELHVNEVSNCKIIDLESQQLIKRESTEYRYLVVTNKETFVCETSVLNGHYNVSDLFYRLKKGQKYTFKVSGFGKGFFNRNYRNILEFKKSK